MISNPERPILAASPGPADREGVTRICKEAGVPTRFTAAGPRLTWCGSAPRRPTCPTSTRWDPAHGRLRSGPPQAGVRQPHQPDGQSPHNHRHAPRHARGRRRRGKEAIDDAGEGGGFIPLHGDQCGRDTPDENILASSTWPAPTVATERTEDSLDRVEVAVAEHRARLEVARLRPLVPAIDGDERRLIGMGIA